MQSKLFEVALVCLILGTSYPAAAQTNAGRILGSVRDQTGAVLVGATVVIEDVERDVSRTLATDQAGDYVAPNIPPGLYKLAAIFANFNRVERCNVRLEAAKDVRIDFVLQPGDVAETIMVTAEATLVESTNDVLGGTLSNATINDLPLNGRDFQNLLVLRPGVMRYPGGGIGSVSANGIRPEDNNYMVDGIDNNDPYFGQSVINGAGVQGTPATILPIDAIQEFNAQENPPAEYGWKPGAIVNVAFKSGSDAWHGTAYDFARNSALDARNFFNIAPEPRKPLRLNQYGGTVGGPVVRHKLFFFLGFEAVGDLVSVTEEVPSPATVHLPDPAVPNCTHIAAGDCGNSIPDAIADLRGGGIAVSPLSLRLATLFPPNRGTNVLGSNMFSTGFPNTDRGDNGLAKVDYHMNSRNVFSGAYFIGDSLQTDQDTPVLQQAWESQAVTRAQVLGANWIWAADARWVNAARLGYNRLSQSFLTADSNVSPVNYGINTGIANPLNYGMPQLDGLRFPSHGRHVRVAAAAAPCPDFPFSR